MPSKEKTISISAHLSGSLVGLIGRQEIGGLRSLRSCGEYGLLVGLQYLEPAVDVGGVVSAGCLGDAQVGAEECGAKFRDEFLDGVGVVAKALAELPLAAVFMTGPVGELVEKRAVVGFSG